MNEIYMSSYFDINSKNDTFAPYIASNDKPKEAYSDRDITADVSKALPIPKEGYNNCDSTARVKEGYTPGDFLNLVSSMSNNKMYDMSSNLLYNPSDPEYIPSLREAAIEDKNQLIVQQNTVLALGAMSAASIAIVLYMISNRS